MALGAQLTHPFTENMDTRISPPRRSRPLPWRWRLPPPHRLRSPTQLLFSTVGTAPPPPPHPSAPPNLSSPVTSNPPLEQPSGEICGERHEPVHAHEEEQDGRLVREKEQGCSQIRHTKSRKKTIQLEDAHANNRLLPAITHDGMIDMAIVTRTFGLVGLVAGGIITAASSSWKK
ncbi:uncharacterized protein LOC124662677 [Lolium rigidum]|uniref:uncharacterized protein LOC124662677 n=1 Tax=Lolium rigidum TaxID=89674 RepID=UPI001F5DE8CB|nr:uncharacterized protein LOC124662677 [Lolium rigidum]